MTMQTSKIVRVYRIYRYIFKVSKIFEVPGAGSTLVTLSTLVNNPNKVKYDKNALPLPYRILKRQTVYN